MKTAKQLHILLLLLVMAGLSWSCSHSDDELGGAIDGEHEVSAVTFSLKTAAATNLMAAEPTTRLTEYDENELVQVAVLLFDEYNNLTYKPLWVNKADIEINANESNIKNFTVKVPVGTYDLVVIANANAVLIKHIKELEEGDVVAKDDLLSRLKIVSEEKWSSGSSYSSYYIPMWGEVSKVQVTETANAKVEVDLLRMLAKIDVALTMPEDKRDFVLKSASLYNYNTVGHVVPTKNNWTVEPSIPEGAVITKGPHVYTTNNERSIKGEIYTFEAAVHSDDVKKTTLIIGGVYGGDPDGISYYRIDFKNKADEYIPLLRNYLYNVDIANVYGLGYRDPEDALSRPPVNIEAVVTEWSVANMGAVGDGLHKPYKLVASKRELDLTWGANTYSDLLAVLTNHPDGWKHTVVDEEGNNVDWLKLTNGEGGSGETFAELVLEDNYTGKVRTGYIKLTAGEVGDNLDFTVKVNQESLALQPKDAANSHIVKPNGIGILIPVGRANKSVLGEQLGINEPFTAELVWTEHSGGLTAKSGRPSNIKKVDAIGKGYSGNIYVEPGEYEGNAVVAIKKMDGKILWSWHIWVTDYEPEPIDGIFMDRNLGALSATPGRVTTKGLQYQWGRKDPFTNTSKLTDAVEMIIYDSAGNPIKINKTGDGTLAKSVANPLTFYTGNFWAGARNDTYWKNDSKTIYDPCPKGWRVPDDTVWSNYSKDNSTWDSDRKGRFTDNLGGFYPAAGRRDNSSGELRDDRLEDDGDQRGYYWTSNSKADNPVALRITVKHVNFPTANYKPATGLSVRCVRDVEK